MPTADQIRIRHDRANPRPMQLWWALRPLTSVVRFMQTGAHPDDEISGLLAALAFRDGLNLSYACSTRGEGGQNDIGTESGAALGALRTREMERGCDVLGMRMYWHSTHPDDTITDFGFSKSGDETLGRWGRDRTMQRFVDIVRTEKPDILCPTFLDVPGQHGHHRAMTEAVQAVMSAAADPAFPSDLAPWQVKKLYLPAWSGAGRSYDDDVPPPATTLTVPGADGEALTGWSWNRIGQQSRAYHRTQGMGHWIPAGGGQDWPLHLAQSHVAGPDRSLWSGLHRTLADLATLPSAGPIAIALKDAQSAINATVQAYPDFAAVADHATEALHHVRAALESCPSEAAHDIHHHLVAKDAQLANVLRLALGVEARARTASVFLDAASPTALTTEVDAGMADGVSAKVALPQGWAGTADRLSVSSDAATTDSYRASYDPLAPDAPNLHLTLNASGTEVSLPVAFEREPFVLPEYRVALAPSSVLLNTATADRTFAITVSDMSPRDGKLDLTLPDGWQALPTQTGFSVTAPQDLRAGHFQIEARINGKPAQSVRLIEHDHINPTACTEPATVTVGAVDIALPDAKVGYIGGGNDRVGAWLDAMGVDVTPLSDAHLSNEAALAEFNAIVVGIFAMRFRPGLTEAVPALHRWTEAGGTLVTLYHRPWDNWDPDAIPPRRLEIGQPSLRWRVTNEAAPVTQLAEHEILANPNDIGTADWDGWVKERGLYFAKSWDAAYQPLLSMADPGEDALTGALLVADIGRGRHLHTSLILHHQMEHLVPGAFRLLANFIAPRAPA